MNKKKSNLNLWRRYRYLPEEVNSGHVLNKSFENNEGDPISLPFLVTMW